MTLYNKDRIVSADKVEIKDSFKDRYQYILGDQYDEYMKYSFTYLRKCIRVNTLKTTVEELKNRLEEQEWVLTPIPWCPEGFFIEGHKTKHRFDIGNAIEHTLGYFYVQESASMLPPVVLFSDKDEIDCTDFKVLDLCAAPGSKTTQIAMYMKNKGVLIANDVDVGRLKPLTMNLQRMGVTNALVTMNAFQKSKNSTKPRNPFLHFNSDNELIPILDEEGNPKAFDRILVDAPCSGTGTIRRSFKTLSMYSYGLVNRLVRIQKSLILHSFSMLKPGGIMVYSTCTQEPLENENVISFLLEKCEDAEVLDIELNINRQEAIEEFETMRYNPEVKKCLRIYPQDNDSEGFFVAKIRKKLN